MSVPQSQRTKPSFQTPCCINVSQTYREIFIVDVSEIPIFSPKQQLIQTITQAMLHFELRTRHSLYLVWKNWPKVGYRPVCAWTSVYCSPAHCFFKYGSGNLTGSQTAIWLGLSFRNDLATARLRGTSFVLHYSCSVLLNLENEDAAAATAALQGMQWGGYHDGCHSSCRIPSTSSRQQYSSAVQCSS